MLYVVGTIVGRPRGITPGTPFGRALVAWMGDSGLNYRELADRLDYTRQYVGQVIRGDARPSWDFLTRLNTKCGEPIEKWARIAGLQSAADPLTDAAPAGRGGAPTAIMQIATLAAEEALWRAGVVRESRLVYDTAPNAAIAWHRGVERLISIYRSEAVLPSLRAALDIGMPSEDDPIEDVEPRLAALEWSIQKTYLDAGKPLPEGVSPVVPPEGVKKVNP